MLKKVQNFLNKKGNEVFNELNDESKAHKAVNELVVKTENLLNLHKKTMPEESVLAANAMLTELRVLLHKDSQLAAPHWPQHQYDLLNNSLDVIGKYERPLEAAPGFFNQFKAIINNLVENLTGTKDFLPVEKTVIGENLNFQAVKGKIKEMKEGFESPEPDKPSLK